jgi:hypothetical protein
MNLTRLIALATSTTIGIEISPTWEAALASAVASILVLLTSAAIAMLKAWSQRWIRGPGNDDLEEEGEDPEEK